MKIALLALAPFAFHLYAQPGTISTVAGTGVAGYSGDGGPASAAQLNGNVYVSNDAAGNVYISDTLNNRIRKIDTQGIITTIAGNGAAAFSGDGGLAVNASIWVPSGVVPDGQGNVYFTDPGNARVRKIDTQGVISTVAGTGVSGYNGDHLPATQAELHAAVRVAVDPAGNLYIADQSNNRIRKVDSSGIITTLAGNGVQGFGGDHGPAVQAELNNPTSVVLGTAGYLYFADQYNHRIRRVDAQGIITTIAGNGTPGYSGDGGPATSATLNYPGGLIADANGNLFIADNNNFVVREVTPDGNIHTIAGNGSQGYSGDGGPATSAELNGQFGLAIDPRGNLLIADAANNRIRLVQGVSSITPVFTSDAVTNAASFVSGGSAGELVTVFGTHLSVNLSGIATAAATPLPLTLGGVSITVNGVSAPILAVANVDGQEQINFQMPWEVAGQSSVSTIVNNSLAASATVPVALTPAQPGVFVIGSGYGAIEHVDGTVVSAANPAAPGEVVVVFANGLGAVTPALSTGQVTPGTEIFNTVVTPTVTIGGIAANVLFSGAAPYFVGLNQLNVQVPAMAGSGNQNLVVMSSGIYSQAVAIAIQ